MQTHVMLKYIIEAKYYDQWDNWCISQYQITPNNQIVEWTNASKYGAQ